MPCIYLHQSDYLQSLFIYDFPKATCMGNLGTHAQLLYVGSNFNQDCQYILTAKDFAVGRTCAIIRS